MNEQEFFDLALKVIGSQASQPEREQLEALLASQPELKAEFAQIQADTRLAKRVLPLLAATQSTAGEFPAYAGERLQTKVRETLGRPQAAELKATWNWQRVFGGKRGLGQDAQGTLGRDAQGTLGQDAQGTLGQDAQGTLGRDAQAAYAWIWRWVLGLAVATAAVALLLVPVLFRPSKLVVQVAMLDTAGAVRGQDGDVAVLEREWTGSDVQTFDSADALESWQANWPRAGVAAKVIYNRAAGELRVIVLAGGKTQEKTFLVERDLAATLKQATAFIQKQTPR